MSNKYFLNKIACGYLLGLLVAVFFTHLMKWIIFYEEKPLIRTFFGFIKNNQNRKAKNTVFELDEEQSRILEDKF